MNPTLDQVVAQAELLPSAERELLLARVRQTLMPTTKPEIEAAWIEEIDWRLEAIDGGLSTSVRWDLARKDLGLVDTKTRAATF